MNQFVYSNQNKLLIKVYDRFRTGIKLNQLAE